MKTSSVILATAILAATPKRVCGGATAEAHAAKKSGKKAEATNEAPAEPEILDVPDLSPQPVEICELVPLKSLVLDADTQNRHHLDPETVERYKTDIKDAKKAGGENPMPPIDAVRDRDGKLYPFDGFHRIDAHKGAGEKEISTNIYEPPTGWSGKDYAVLLSLGVNATHGKTRTQKDTQYALKRVMTHPQWSKWTNTKLAEIVHCSEGTVRNHRSAFAPSERLFKRKGKVIKMKTGNNGRKGAKPPKASKKTGSKKGSASTNGSAGAAGSTEGATNTAASESKAMQERKQMIFKISEAQPGDRVGEVRIALENDVLGLSLKDLRDWGMNSKNRIAQLTALILDKRWKPSRAIGFIDRGITPKTNLDDLALLLLTKPDKFTYTVAGLEVAVGPKAIEIVLSTAPISD